MCYNMWMGKGKPIHDAVLSNLGNNVHKFIGKTCPFWREVGQFKNWYCHISVEWKWDLSCFLIIIMIPSQGETTHIKTAQCEGSQLKGHFQGPSVSSGCVKGVHRICYLPVIYLSYVTQLSLCTLYTNNPQGSWSGESCSPQV